MNTSCLARTVVNQAEVDDRVHHSITKRESTCLTLTDFTACSLGCTLLGGCTLTYIHGTVDIRLGTLNVCGPVNGGTFNLNVSISGTGGITVGGHVTVNAPLTYSGPTHVGGALCVNGYNFYYCCQ